jgi:hypothetical protein
LLGIGGRGGLMLVNMLIFMVTSRLLTPADFGIFAVAQLCIDLASWHGYLVRNHVYTARMHRSPAHVIWRLVLECRRCARLSWAAEFKKAFVILRDSIAGLWFKPDVADLDVRANEATIEYMSPALRCSLNAYEKPWKGGDYK